MKQSLLLVLMLINFCFIPGSKGQNLGSCQENILLGKDLYEKGKIEEVIALLKPCTGIDIEPKVRWQAWRLLTMAYLAGNNAVEARMSCENMLALNPTYKYSLVYDQADFAKLLNSITVIPEFSLGFAVSLGTNTTLPQVKSSYVIADYDKTYTPLSSFQFGVSLGYKLNKNFEMKLSGLFSRKIFKVNYSVADWDMQVSEKLAYIDLPLQVNYYFLPDKKIQPFLSTGVFGSILLNSYTSYEARNTFSQMKNELNEVNTLTDRNRFYGGVSMGLGVNYVRKKGQFYLQGIYYKGFGELSKIPGEAINNSIKYGYYYLEDKISLDNISINLGYAFHLNYKVIRNK